MNIIHLAYLVMFVGGLCVAFAIFIYGIVYKTRESGRATVDYPIAVLATVHLALGIGLFLSGVDMLLGTNNISIFGIDGSRIICK